MRIQVLTLFPQIIEQAVGAGVLGQAIERGLLSVQTLQLRQFATDRYGSVDDRPFGGGEGMILRPDIAAAAVEEAKAAGATRVIYLSPQGRRLDDATVRRLAWEPSLTLLCGRYEGVDQRVLNQLVDEEISIGDYVLSGGEFAALVMIDAVSRMIPGTLGHPKSAAHDSFAQGLLEHPHFTRPAAWRGQKVPEALQSGHHERIAAWRSQLSRLVSLKKRPELFGALPGKERREAFLFWREMTAEERDVCGLGDLQESDFPEGGTA